MASPFSLFRRHQKTMIAVLGVLCMLAFLIFPALQRMEGSRRQNQDPVVLTTNDGPIGEIEIHNMRQSRRTVNAFLQNLCYATATSLQEEMGAGALAAEDIAGFLMRDLQTRDGLLMPDSEESIVENMLLVQKADEMGMVISDAAVNDFLKALTRNKVPAATIQGILNRLRVTQGQIFDALAYELKASRMRLLFASNLTGEPPALRLEYYSRFHTIIDIATIPIAVADFVGEVTAQPKEGELEALFEKYKNDYPEPGSPDPGFHDPIRAKFQYFLAKVEDFVDVEEPTEEEVEKYYEENKDRDFRIRQAAATPGASFPGITGGDAEQSLDTQTPGEPTSSDETPSADAPSEEKPSEEKPSDETLNDETTSEEEASDETSDEAASTDELFCGDESSESASPEEDEAGPDESNADDATTDAPSDDPVPENAEEKPAAGDEPNEPSDEEAEPAGDASAGTADETPTGDADAADSSSAVVPTEVIDDITNEFALPQSIDDVPNLEFWPRWMALGQARELAKQEKEFLARQIARGKIELIFDQIEGEMDDYATKRAEYEDALVDKKPAKKPKPLDLDAIAKRFPVTAHETRLISAIEAALSTDIGKSTIDGMFTIDGQYAFPRVAYLSIGVFIPKRSLDQSGNHYLFWKVEQTDDKVPDFAEAKDAVLKAWKVIQARKLARERAEQLAKSASETSAPLAAVFADDPSLIPTDSGPFTWLTYGSAQAAMLDRRPPQLSEVPGVIDPGDGFMRDVFAIPAGESGVAFNNPKTICYVARVRSKSPNETELQEEFFAETSQPGGYSQYNRAASTDQYEILRNWLAQLKQEAGVAWARAPLPASRR